MTPLYIFDLDGTLALIEHRRHLVEKKLCASCSGVGQVPRKPVEIEFHVVKGVALQAMETCSTCDGMGITTPDWRAFFAACVDDKPNLPVIDTLHSLARAGAEIRIWSGRSAEVMKETVEWLNAQVGVQMQILMRPDGDYTPDEELKQLWLLNLPPVDLRRLTAVFDDRDKVVRMWRAHGVACFQVAPGDF